MRKEFLGRKNGSSAEKASGNLEKTHLNKYTVAPLAGAWIETSPHRLLDIEPKVAPLTGAWIERIIFGSD